MRIEVSGVIRCRPGCGRRRRGGVYVALGRGAGRARPPPPPGARPGRRPLEEAALKVEEDRGEPPGGGKPETPRAPARERPAALLACRCRVRNTASRRRTHAGLVRSCRRRARGCRRSGGLHLYCVATARGRAVHALRQVERRSVPLTARRGRFRSTSTLQSRTRSKDDQGARPIRRVRAGALAKKARRTTPDEGKSLEAVRGSRCWTLYSEAPRALATSTRRLARWRATSRADLTSDAAERKR